MQHSKILKKILVIFTFLILLNTTTLFGQSFFSKNTFIFETTTSQDECNRILGIWHKNKCWIKFDEFGISDDALSEYLDEEFNNIIEAEIKLEGGLVREMTYPLGFTLVYSTENTIVVSSTFNLKERTLYMVIDKNKMQNQAVFEINTPVSIWDGDIIHKTSRVVNKIAEGEVKVTIDRNNYIFDGKGEIEILDEKSRDEQFKKLKINQNEIQKAEETFTNTLLTNVPVPYRLPIQFKVNESILKAGSTQLKIVRNKAFLSGEIGTRTYFQLLNLINDNPQVTTLVLLSIPGSVNEEINVHLGSMIRKAELNTELTSESRVATGGLYLFLGGKNRTWSKASKLGVNSWCCVNGREAKDVPIDHPRHSYYSDFFVKMLGPKNGKEFYFFILQYAGNNNIFELTDSEIRKFGLAKVVD